LDSHPAPRVRPDGETYWRTRWQTWDSTFGLEKHSVRLSQIVDDKRLKQTYRANAASSFVDSSPTAYWDERIPQNSVKTAGSGLRIDVLGVSKDGTTYRVWVMH
jgi:immune inhibitor A